VRIKYEKSQYTAHPSSEPVNYIGIFGVGGAQWFFIMDQGGLLAAPHEDFSLCKINITIWTNQPKFYESVIY
jgi:hypothetical protein